MPSLSESVIRAACGKGVWDRAEELLYWPALSALSLCGEDDPLELFGQCAGSEGQSYVVRARVQDGAIAEATCSCAFDGRGQCKHRIALLLKLVREDKKFQKFPALIEMIAQCSPETLRDIVATMVRRSPDLLPLVATSRGSANGEESVRETLRRALSGRTALDGALAIERVFGQVSQLEARGESFAAGEIWSTALEELVHAAAGFEQLYDLQLEYSDGYDEEEGDFGDDWARMAVEGLGRALEVETLAPEAKRKWLRSLWEADRAADDYEYFSLPHLVRELLSRFAPDDLWADIEATVCAELKSNVSAGEDHRRGYDVEFLLGRLNSRGRSKEADALIAQWGTTKQQFDLKIRKGDVVGAYQLASRSSHLASSHLTGWATQLETAGEPELALRLALAAQQGPNPYAQYGASPRDSSWTEWLCDFYLRHKRAKEARVEAVRLFARSPHDAQFARLKSAVELMGQWSQERDAVEREVGSLAGKDWHGNSREGEVALALRLKEGDPTRVYALFETFSEKERARFLEAVADAIETELPAEALTLWCELSEWRIDNREQNAARRSYALAAQSLLRARELHKKLGSIKKWNDYLQTLRGVYKPLRALHDEINKAGL